VQSTTLDQFLFVFRQFTRLPAINQTFINILSRNGFMGSAAPRRGKRKAKIIGYGKWKKERERERGIEGLPGMLERRHGSSSKTNPYVSVSISRPSCRRCVVLLLHFECSSNACNCNVSNRFSVIGDWSSFFNRQSQYSPWQNSINMLCWRGVKHQWMNEWINQSILALGKLPDLVTAELRFTYLYVCKTSSAAF